MSVLQIAEIARELSDEFRIKTSSAMPWGTIKGISNLLAHAYGEVDENML